jgi:hypothetical protein
VLIEPNMGVPRAGRFPDDPEATLRCWAILLSRTSEDGCVCERTERRAMTGDQSRPLKADDRVCWKASATDQGVVVGTDWSGVTVAWDDGDTNTIQHNDMSQIERALIRFDA